jgi:CelD/BcsL family acetyltransferase involved in cellulose biosynthesis
MIYVQEINDIRQLAGIRLLWNALLPQTPGASFFHSLDWLEIYWRHFGAGQRLRVLVVSVDGRPLGILPLAVRT